MPRSPDERIEQLERSVKLYRLLAVLLAVFVFVSQRDRIVGWIDSMENWAHKVTNAASG